MATASAKFVDKLEEADQGVGISKTHLENKMYEAEKADEIQQYTDPKAPPRRKDPLPGLAGRYNTPAGSGAAARLTRKPESNDVDPVPLPAPPLSLEEVSRKARVETDAMPLEQKWIDLHTNVLGELKPMNVDPKGVKTLSKPVNRLGGSKTSIFVATFSAGVFGVDVNSGAKIVFDLAQSTLPFHICSGFALASATLKGVPINAIYASYTTHIRKVRSIVEDGGEDLDDYVEVIKAVLDNHSKTTVRFLREFHALNAFGWMGVDEAKISFRSWMNELLEPLVHTIKKIQDDIATKTLWRQVRDRNGERAQFVSTIEDESDSD